MFGLSFTALTVGFGVGLIVGWNVLPQPKWVSAIYRWVGRSIDDWLND